MQAVKGIRGQMDPDELTRIGTKDPGGHMAEHGASGHVRGCGHDFKTISLRPRDQAGALSHPGLVECGPV